MERTVAIDGVVNVADSTAQAVDSQLEKMIPDDTWCNDTNDHN